MKNYLRPEQLATALSKYEKERKVLGIDCGGDKDSSAKGKTYAILAVSGNSNKWQVLIHGCLPAGYLDEYESIFQKIDVVAVDAVLSLPFGLVASEEEIKNTNVAGAERLCELFAGNVLKSPVASVGWRILAQASVRWMRLLERDRKPGMGLKEDRYIEVNPTSSRFAYYMSMQCDYYAGRMKTKLDNLKKKGLPKNIIIKNKPHGGSDVQDALWALMTGIHRLRGECHEPPRDWPDKHGWIWIPRVRSSSKIDVIGYKEFLKIRYRCCQMDEIHPIKLKSKCSISETILQERRSGW